MDKGGRKWNLNRIGAEPPKVRGGTVSALVGALPQLCRGGLSLSVAATAACGALLAGTMHEATVAFVAVLLLAAGASVLNQLQSVVHTMIWKVL